MNEPVASRPHWPDLPDMPTDPSKGLKPWSWALECLEKSHTYWIATTRPGGRPHLMIVWGVWWEDAFWFSTGPNTRKAKNIAAHNFCSIAPKSRRSRHPRGVPQEIKDRAVWKSLSAVYNKKYGGNLEPVLRNPAAAMSTVSNPKPPSARTNTRIISPNPPPAGASRKR